MNQNKFAIDLERLWCLYQVEMEQIAYEEKILKDNEQRNNQITEQTATDLPVAREEKKLSESGSIDNKINTEEPSDLQERIGELIDEYDMEEKRGNFFAARNKLIERKKLITKEYYLKRNLFKHGASLQNSEEHSEEQNSNSL